MALTPTITEQIDIGNALLVIGTIAASGNYTQNAESLSFANKPLQATGKPLLLVVEPRVAGWLATYTPGTTRDNGIVRFYRQSAATGELAQEATAAYPANLSATALTFFAIFKKLT